MKKKILLIKTNTPPKTQEEQIKLVIQSILKAYKSTFDALN